MPVKRIRLFQHVNFSEMISFKNSIMGEHGTLTSNTVDKAVQISPPKTLKSLHSQYICIQYMSLQVHLSTACKLEMTNIS